MTDLTKLREPFPPERISWRVGSTTKDKSRGMALAYIDARDVQDRLDDVCGIGNWQCRYSHATDKKTVCEIGIRSPAGEWIWKADGAGDTDVEAEKGALSDAFKRSAVRWGIGRYLYDLDSPWVELEPKGNSYVIKPSELDRLRAILEGKKPPAPKQAETKPATGERAQKAWAWAQEQSELIRKMGDSKRFNQWHDDNATAIATLKDVAPEAHARLLEEIDNCMSRFNPMAA